MKAKEIAFNYIDKNRRERRYITTYSSIHYPQFKTLDELIDHLKSKYEITSEIKIYDTEFIFL